MIAFFVGIAVLIICAVVTSDRKRLIPPKDKTPIDDKKIIKSAEPKEVPTAAEPTTAEFKNSGGLNILLYVGCFLVIAALMGYVSTVDKDLIPPIVLTVTSIALVASILIFKFVKFLKPSSYAFNLTALIMFLCWIPSLEALGLSWGYSCLASFLFLTGAGIISASIFKDKALWYVPASSLIGLLISTFAVIDDEIAAEYRLFIYGSVVAFMLLGIALRYFWKAKVTWLPIQTRHVTRSFSFVYPILGGFFALFACDDLGRFPFILTIFALLLSIYLVLDQIIVKKKSLINMLRICLEFVCIALAIDLSFMPAFANDTDLQRNIILFTILISSIVQGIISILLFATKHDEESHSRERWVFAISLIGLAICSTIATAEKGYSSITSSDFMITFIALSAQFATIIFSLLALFFDRNPLMLIITSLSLCEITLSNLNNSSVAACIILSVGAVIFSASYSALRKMDKKYALIASILPATFCTLLGLSIGEQESIAYIPVLGIGISMAVQGFILKNAGLRIAGVYVTALGIINAWSSMRTGFTIIESSPCRNIYRNRYDIMPCHNSTIDYPIWVYVIDSIICLVPPAAAFFLSIFDKKKPKTLQDGTVTTSITPNFMIGGILAIINAVFIIPFLYADLDFLNFTLALAMLIGLLIWSAAKKWMSFEVTSLVAILFLVLEKVGENIWITLIIAGMGIIGIVIFISYKNYKKFNNNQTAAPASASAPKVQEKTEPNTVEQPAKEEPKVEEKKD